MELGVDFLKCLINLDLYAEKHGFVVTRTLFVDLFAIMLKHAFGTAIEGVYLRNRSDGKLFNLSD